RLNSDPSRSTIARRPLRVRFEARFFFEPGDLRRQASDLGIKLVDFGFVASCLRRQILAGFKQARESLESDVFPFSQLIGMNAMLLGDLSLRLLFLEHLADDLRFERWCMSFSYLFHGGHYPP